MISKDEEKLDKAKQEITQITNNQEINTICCDLSSKRSVDECINNNNPDLSIYGLVNNAAINPLGRTLQKQRSQIG